MILNAKNQYTLNQFVACKENMRKSWQILSKLSGHNKPYNIIKKLSTNHGLVTGEQDIAEAFDDHFCSIAVNLENNLPHNQISHTLFLVPTCPQSFYLFPITETECTNLISSLEVTKTDLNLMPVKISKSLKNYLAPLTKLVNL